MLADIDEAALAVPTVPFQLPTAVGVVRVRCGRLVHRVVDGCSVPLLERATADKRGRGTSVVQGQHSITAVLSVVLARFSVVRMIGKPNAGRRGSGKA